MASASTSSRMRVQYLARDEDEEEDMGFETQYVPVSGLKEHIGWRGRAGAAGVAR